METVFRTGFATAALVTAFVLGTITFQSFGGMADLDLDDPAVVRGALIPIGLLWVIIGSFVGRWWVVVVPLVPYLILLIAAGGEVRNVLEGVPLEQLLGVASGALAIGVLISGPNH